MPPDGMRIFQIPPNGFQICVKCHVYLLGVFGVLGVLGVFGVFGAFGAFGVFGIV